ncbi:hypothetical protein TNCV_3184901 [Trichonephila clavipes]|nr:hypothetical protein TNCV_3184901 [Trichonephila clavipes]
MDVYVSFVCGIGYYNCHRGVLLQNSGGIEPNSKGTCSVLKATSKNFHWTWSDVTVDQLSLYMVDLQWYQELNSQLERRYTDHKKKYVKIGETGNVSEEFVYLAWQIIFDDVQEMLDSHNQELTTDQFIEMHEKEHDIEENMCP